MHSLFALVNKRLVRYCFLLIILLFAGWSNAQTPNFRKSQTIVKSYEGLGLATDIYLPVEEGKYPVILVRVPYGSENKAWLGEFFAAEDYAVVVQNVRGTHGSEGSFFPFAYEKKDGLKTLEWIEQQPWSNGKVGLWGASYGAYCGFELAATSHPSVKTMIQVSGWSDLKPFLSPGGAFHLMAHLRWAYSYLSGQPDPPPQAWDGIFKTVPINKFFSGFEEIMSEQARNSYPYDSVSIPIFHLTGWHDYLYANTLSAYASLHRREPETGFQRIIIGPWAHNDVLSGATAVGDEDFGLEAKMGLENTLELSLIWFDFYLQGVKNAVNKEPGARIFVMEENRWQDFDSWPPSETRYQKWYLDSKDGANGLNGSGRLKTSRPSGQKSDTFIFNPLDPVPTLGGDNSHFFPENLGPKDQTMLEQRHDMLVYTSEPLKKPLLLVGPIKMVLFAATEGKDTDFTAKLVEVREDGYARIIEEGIIRGRHALRGDPFALLEPGKVYEFEIDLGATAIRLKKGSRLRIEVSSSNFPKYDRNPNTGEDPFAATEFKTVKQTVYHSPEYASHVILPVLEEK